VNLAKIATEYERLNGLSALTAHQAARKASLMAIMRHEVGQAGRDRKILALAYDKGDQKDLTRGGSGKPRGIRSMDFQAVRPNRNPRVHDGRPVMHREPSNGLYR
jgi:hypothetical protein